MSMYVYIYILGQVAHPPSCGSSIPVRCCPWRQLGVVATGVSFFGDVDQHRMFLGDTGYMGIEQIVG